VVSVDDLGKGQKRARGEVTVHDNCGNAVSGAVVTGTFTGDFNGSVSATTDANGVVVLLSAAKKGRSHFTLCVDDVPHDSLGYSSGNNVETCDSF